MAVHHAADGQCRIPQGIVVTGEIESSEDVIVEGRIDGQITALDHHLSIHRTGVVRARIVARAVTLGGTLEGSIVASERVEILPGASMRGHLTTPSLLLMDGARFDGTVDPERSQAAMHVARYRLRSEARVRETPDPAV